MSQFTIVEISEELGVHTEIIYKWIELELVKPFELATPIFDKEDLARMKLILNLQMVHELNHDAIDIILHLVDQIHHLQTEIKSLKKEI